MTTSRPDARSAEAGSTASGAAERTSRCSGARTVAPAGWGKGPRSRDEDIRDRSRRGSEDHHRAGPRRSQNPATAAAAADSRMSEGCCRFGPNPFLFFYFLSPFLSFSCSFFIFLTGVIPVGCECPRAISFRPFWSGSVNFFRFLFRFGLSSFPFFYLFLFSG